ncbi:PAS domain S-box protein [Metabacillus malikii]|uniref:Diguanylate cyclase (GGDEF)-like protein/PAS domain S-box-containing protein n=1 Tax=Metabacillus malikii TaxID=1504265 RepID=A0ABT9ZM89_9BACI|nr:PAS domain S-box protein [Metabacillus malikii]MDQ0233393.1 diguanylate cyclase (GGDEF)-like protein/PAS domain S-box-containing protein [Metabacillus malikii]
MNTFDQLKHIDLFFQIFNGMSDMVFLSEVEKIGEYRYILANRPAIELLGIESIPSGKLLHDVVPVDSYRLLNEKYIEAITLKQPVTYEDKIIIQGNFIYYESTVTPIYDDAGTCTHILAIVRDITDRKVKDKEIKRMKDRLELIFKNAADAIYTFDRDLQYVSVNNAFVAMLGWTLKELLADKSISIFPVDEREDIENIIEKLQNGETIQLHEVQCVTKNGQTIDVLASYSPIFDLDGNFDGGVVMYKDVTERNNIFRELKNNEYKYRLIAEHSTDLIKVIDTEGIVQYASPSHFHILGVEPEYYLNKSILSFLHSEDMHTLKHVITKIMNQKEKEAVEFRRLTKSGEWVWFNAIGTPVVNEAGDVYQIIFEARDMTERKNYEEKLKQLAYHDALTGLPNRILFTKKLIEEMKRAERSQKMIAVMFLDLDRFKQINDTMGHDIGDELLVCFAERVSRCLGEKDMMARFGGDEFVIMLTDFTQGDHAINIADQIIQALQQEWVIEEYRFKSTSSVGMSFYPPYEQTDKMLIKHADLALYEAKEKGRNNIQIYEYE